MTLYAVHIQGPDEIIAAPSERDAKALADKMNAWISERIKEFYCEAVVIKWPYARTLFM